MQKKSANQFILINERIGIWDFIWKYTLRDFILGCASITPASIGIGLRMFLYKFAFKSCGKGLLIKSFVTVKFPERIFVGDHVGISEYSILDGDGGIAIGHFTRIASHVSIIAFSHIYADPSIPIKLQGKTSKGISIGKDVWIGTGAKILDGVTIGDGSIIGAGSVVTEDIPPYSVAVGTPARVIKKRSQV